jgi:hypothetical protein
MIEISHDLSKANWQQMKQVYESVGWTKHSEEIIQQVFQASNVIVLAFCDGRIVGLAALSPMGCLMLPFMTSLFIAIFRGLASEKQSSKICLTSCSIFHKKFDTGIEEYFPQWNVVSDMLCTMVQEIFDNWKRELTNIINKNECNTVDIHSLLHLVEHTSYHLGQIVDRVKKATGISFQFCQNGLNESMLRSIIEREINE